MDRVELDSLPADFLTNPYPYYSYLRAEDPVHLSARGVWILTRYEDVSLVLRDPRFGRKAFQEFLPGAYSEPGEPAEASLLFQDAPNHTRLRCLVGKVFTFDLVQSLRPRIQRAVDDLLDRMRGRAGVDLISDFAFPLPIEVILELLGLPHADRDFLLQCAMDLARFMQAPPVAPASEGAVKVHEAIAAYFQELLGARRRNPSCDLLSNLIEVRDNGDRLTEFELMDICGLLFIAGHETTVNLIGNGLLTLLLHPGDLRRVRENPALLHSAVEELLRYESPVQRAGRIAGDHIEIGNKTIPRGAVVSAVIGAANRDPVRFHEPDRLDVARRNNCHLALGSGERYCLGAALARLEAQIGIGSLIRHWPAIELAAGPPAWQPSAETRGLKELHVIL